MSGVSRFSTLSINYLLFFFWILSLNFWNQAQRHELVEVIKNESPQ